MTQDDLRLIEKLVSDSHNSLLEYVNELVKRVTNLADHVQINRERIEELENGKYR